ncbi:heme o synthase [Hyphococcus flavus]|uniref:Protoheme IX farnesyltransferase n=1 Tax=Hyphococcus flavus TaxID=1866326 RepID=A0AAE9ZHD6_9PROT|nr:heme o synthase [Hyphococcus flavus]WDI33093.1 heme o synthase [Hyphococcus flavus]
MSDTAMPQQAYDLAGPKDYFALLKPRVMSLVIFTAFVGMALAPGALNPVLAAVSLLAIAVGAGASGALNMWWDADIDAVMARTVSRPIPSGRVPRSEAAAFGGFLSLLSVFLLALASNYLAAGLLAFTIFFYVVIYSMWLKRSTPQNIVIGGAAGALPPVVGWAAMSGTAPLEAWVLFAIIFLWTPPHFWALALYKRGDYERAGVPMMPVVKGEASTRKQIFAYALILAASGVAPFFIDMAGLFYLSVSAVLGACFVWLSWKVLRADEGEQGPAKKLFGFSILYLFGLFAALLVERLASFYV